MSEQNTSEFKTTVVTVTFQEGITYGQRQKAISEMVLNQYNYLKSLGFHMTTHTVTRQDENSASILIEYKQR